MHRALPKLLPLVFASITLVAAGCSTAPSRTSVTAAEHSDLLKAAVASGDCERAASVLAQIVTGTTPTDAIADARLEAAYACTLAQDADRVAALTDAYLAAHPLHPNHDYAAYLRALAEFGAWRRLESAATPDDQAAQARRAFSAFRHLIDRYPRSRFREQLPPYLAALRNGLADLELRQAADELERGNAETAVARAQYVVDNYPETDVVLPALALMVKGYQTLQRPDAASAAMHRLEGRFRVWTQSRQANL